MDDNLEPEWDKTNLKRGQERDEFCQKILKEREQEQESEEEHKLYYLDTEGILNKKGEGAQDRLVLPKPYVRKVVKDSIDNSIIAHPGKEKKLQPLRCRF